MSGTWPTSFLPENLGQWAIAHDDAPHHQLIVGDGGLGVAAVLIEPIREERVDVAQLH